MPATRAGQLLMALKKEHGEPSRFMIYPVKSVITLPRPVQAANSNIMYPLMRPYAYANIKFDKQDSLMIYNVIEPKLTEFEAHVLQKIKEGLVQIIDISFEDIKETGVMAFLEENVDRLLYEYDFNMSRKEYVKIMYYIYRDFVGLNKIEPFMHDPYIEDIGCLPEDEKLFVRKDGKTQLLKISDAIGLDSKNSTEIKIPIKDIEVLSFNPETLKTEYKRITGMLKKENRHGYYFDVKTQGGNRIKVSPDHPMLVLTKYGIEKKKADSIKEGDYLLRLKKTDIESSGSKELDLIEAFKQNRKIRIKGIKHLIKSNIAVGKKLGISNRTIANWKCNNSMPLWAYLQLEKDKASRRTLQVGLQGGKNWLPAVIDINEDFALFTGFFLAEGYYETAGISFAFGKHEKEFHELISHLGQKIFGATTSILEKKSCTIVYCGGMLLRRIFEHILNIEGDSHKKKVPDMAYSWNAEMLAKLVEGYFLGDGYFRISETTKKAVIATASRDLTIGIRFILYRLGIFTRIDERNRKFANTWEISMEGGSVLNKFARDILGELSEAPAFSTTTELYPSFLFSKGDYRNADRKIVGNSIRKDGKLGIKFAQASSSSLLHKLLNGDVHPVKVTDINPVPYSKPFYDIEVEDNHNFMHGDFIFTSNCDGVGIPIYVIHQKFGSMRTNIIYNDIEELKEFVTKLAERCDRYISYAEPLLDGTLKDGTRVQASLASDVTTRGPTFSLRKFRDVPLTPVDMVRLNTASAEMLAYLWFAVENGANMLIAGGVSTGKTSLLNALSMFIPGDAKIVSIEDTKELNLPHENWIPGVTRAGFAGSGMGEVSMFQLLRESFRQNPDYLIVGEIRGKEAYVMFQGMASGHPSISTMHAGSVDDLMKRLQTKPINLSAGLLESLNAVIVMIHAREKGKSARRVKEIVEIESIDPQTGAPRTIKSFAWIPHDDVFEYRGDSWLLHRISTEKGMSMNNVLKELSRRKKFIQWMVEKNLATVKEQARYINLYYKNPAITEKLLAGIKVGEAELSE